MLVLTRKLNERIVIGDNIRITVVGIRGHHVRLGIEAPQDVTILRDELQRFAAPAGDNGAQAAAAPPPATEHALHLSMAAGFGH
jgi:carbon storage regulator CsrA